MESINSNDLKFKYEVYGLKIHSEIFFPELIPLESKSADITIICDTINIPTTNIEREGLNFKITNNSIYRFWDGIGIFKITNSSITVNSIPHLNSTILRNFILGTILATVLRLRGLFILHASSIKINDYGVAFSGFKGYGKSTTAMAFYLEGYPVIADDYIALEFTDNNTPLIYPGFPCLRLSSNSREFMGLNKINNDLLDKTYAYVPKLFSKNNVLLKKIYIIERGEEAEIIDITTQDAFMELIKNTFGIHIFSKSELPNNFFMCEKILKNIHISILRIPDSLEKLNEIVKIVEDDLGDDL